MIEDRRRDPRFNLLYYFEIKDSDSGESLGRVVNCSESGILMMTKDSSKASLKEGKQLKIDIIIKAEDNKKISCEAEVVRIVESPTPDYNDVAIKLISIAPDDLDTLRTTIEEYSFGQPI